MEQGMEPKVVVVESSSETSPGTEKNKNVSEKIDSELNSNSKRRHSKATMRKKRSEEGPQDSLDAKQNAAVGKGDADNVKSGPGRTKDS